MKPDLPPQAAAGVAAALAAEVDRLERTARWYQEHPGLLHRWIEAILASPESFDEVAERSADHANGFAKIVLGHASHPRVHRLRLHRWSSPPLRSTVNEAPHGHRWPFASWVVDGLLSERRYSPHPDGEPFDAYRYNRDPTGGATSTLVGPALLLRLAPEVHVASAVYTRLPQDVHLAEPGGETGAVSLVVRGVPTAAAAVYRPPGVVPTGDTRIRPKELRAILEEISALFAALARTPT